MSLYSQNVSNNPLSLDGLIIGNFDEIYVGGQPVVPTDTSGLVPYVGATTAVNLNNKKITTTYTAVNSADLTNKDFTDNTYLPRAGFTVTGGGFVFSGSSIVNLHSTTNIVATTATPTFSLGLNASNNVVKFIGGSGDALLAGGTISVPQQFTGYNQFINALLISTLNFVAPLSAGTPSYILGVNSSGSLVSTTAGDAVLSAGTTFSPQTFTGVNSFTLRTNTAGIDNSNSILQTGALEFTGGGLNPGTAIAFLGVNNAGTVVKTTSTGIPSSLDITQSTSNVEYYPVFVTLPTTSIQTVYNMSGLAFNPSTTILTTTKLKITNVPVGTTQYILAVDSTGNVIRGTVTSSPTQITPTPINTSTTLYPVFLNSTAGGASTTYVESDGSLSYNPSNNNLTVGSGVLLCNTLRPQFGNTLVIDGNGNGNIVFQSASSSIARIDSMGFYVDNIGTSTATTDMNIYASLTTKVNISSGGSIKFSVTPEGTWMPVSSTFSFYITDTAPRTATTTYYRLFGLSGTVYNDYHNRVMWRSTNLAGSGEINTMYLRSSGLNIPLSTTTHPTLDAYELVVGDNSGTVEKSAKIIVRGKALASQLGKGPSIDFTAWDSHATPQGSIELLDDGNWGGVFQFRAKANGAGPAGPLSRVLGMDTTGFIFFCPSQGVAYDYQYIYASNSPTNPYKVCQNMMWQFNRDNIAWTPGVVLGTIFKADEGSKLSWIASGTQYAGGGGTLVFQIAFTLLPSGPVYAYNQNTFTNIGNAHWVCPNINMGYSFPAGSYAVSANGLAASDANDYLRVQVSIMP
jgi:hypothetical protein